MVNVALLLRRPVYVNLLLVVNPKSVVLPLTVIYTW